jgi:choline transport protein
MVMPIIVTLINIASAEALEIVLTMYNSALLASYTITIGCVLLHRVQGRKLPRHARYTLGKWGILVNVLALVFTVPFCIFSFFPPVPNPTAGTMNWSCAMVGGTVVLATVYYLVWGRKLYTPPVETIEDYIERYQTTTAASDREVGSVGTESAGPKDLEL